VRAAQPLILQAAGHGWLFNETPNAPLCCSFCAGVCVPDGIALYLAAQFLLLCLNVKCGLGPNADGCVSAHQKPSDGKLCWQVSICVVVPTVQKLFGVKVSL